MLKVGLSESVDPALHSLLPADIALEIIPRQPQHPIDVDFWIAPPFQKQAAAAWPLLRGVRVVQSVLAGIDALRNLVPSSVTLCDARGVHTISTAEWAVAAILASCKYFPFYDELRRSASWPRRKEAEDRYRALHATTQHFYPPVLLEELHGGRILIVGYGDIGKAIEARLQPFGVIIDRIARTAAQASPPSAICTSSCPLRTSSSSSSPSPARPLASSVPRKSLS